MTSFTASGARRSGDDYQDLQSASILVEWLEQPQTYCWIRLEAMDGSLDDIQAERSDGTRRLVQVKFATNPSEEWDWDSLLKQEPGAKPGTVKRSLLQKWKASLEKIQASTTVSDAVFVTNRAASAEIQNHLIDSGHLDFNGLGPATRAKLAEQLEGEAGALKFFTSFRFLFKDLSIDVLEDSAKTRFLRLGGTTDGWSNLLKCIRKWINHKNEPPPDGLITLKEIREAAQWHHPPQIPQSFLVPPDYAAPLEWSTQHVEKHIGAGGRNATVVTGSPGAGKSTFLSWLVDRLHEAKTPVVRHHYFLSLSDATPRRTAWETAADAILGQLRVGYPDLIAAADSQNPSPEALPKYLAAAGYARRGKDPLVVIIDGLDHVWRETGNDDGLRRLFDLLLPVPEGVALLVGTQNVDSSRLPAKLRDHCPRATWLEIPILDEIRVSEWLAYHKAEFGLPSDPQHAHQVLHDLAHAFFEVTGGHPLVLHYTLNLGRRTTPQLRADDVLKLPKFNPNDNIASYYQALWDDISPEGHNLLHLLAAFHWPWPRNGLVQCLTGHEDTVQLEKAERAIRHVLGTSAVGVTAFHGSLLTFTSSKPDHQSTAESLRPRVTQWLASSAPPYWRWRYEWEQLALSGNVLPLIESATVDWCVNSLVSGRSRSDIGEILALSGVAAVDAGRLAEATERQYLDGYLADSEHVSNVFGPLTRIAMGLRDSSNRMIETAVFVSKASLFTEEEIESVAELAFASGDIETCQLLFNELVSRWNVTLERKGSDDDFSTLAECFPLVIATMLTIPTKGPYQLHWAKAGEEPYWCTADRYARALARCCALGGVTKAHREELKFLANQAERPSPVAVDEIVRLGCRVGFDPTAWIKDQRISSTGLLMSYRFWFAKGNPAVGDLPADFSFDSIPTPSFRRDETKFIELCRRYFFLSVAAAAQERQPPTVSGVADKAAIIREFLERLSELAVNVATERKAGRPAGGDWIIDHLTALDTPEVRANDFDNSLVAPHAVARIVVAIAQDLDELFRAEHGKSSLTEQVVARALDSKRTWAQTWILDRVTRRLAMPDTGAARLLLMKERSRLEENRDYVHQRAEDYAATALFCQLNDFPAGETSTLARLAARNLLGHGSHKDITLFDILGAVQAASTIGIDAKLDHLRALKPVIDVIEDITDGKETRYLKRELGKVLWAISPTAVPGYLRELQDNNEDWDVEACLTNITDTMPLETSYDLAFASTLVHEDALVALKKRSDRGDAAASSVLSRTLTFCGREPISSDASRLPSAKPPDVPIADPKVEEFPPSQLEEFVRRARESTHVDDPLVRWTEHWRVADPSALLDALTTYRDAHDAPLETKTARTVTQLAAELCGQDAEWAWLIAYHRAFYGWSTGLYSRREIEWIWGVIRTRFSQRWVEFLRATSVPRWRTVGGAPNWSVERLVRFLEEMGQEAQIPEVLAAAVRWGGGMAADMSLTAANIVADTSDISVALSLLADRLDCPSRMVQERACWELAECLASVDTRPLTTRAILAWHARESLEMRSCMLLLILNLARVADGLTGNDCVEVARSANIASSIGADLLLRELGSEGVALASSLSFEGSNSGDPDAHFPNPGEEFPLFVGAHLAPLFRHWAQELDGLSFSRQWAWEAGLLAGQRKLSLRPNENFNYHYRDNSERPGLAINNRVSAILRSAYLRALHRCIETKVLASHEANKHARFSAILADPSVWAVHPSARPDWWPKDPGESDGIDTLAVAVGEAVQRLFSMPRSGDTLIYASGPVGTRTRLYADLSIKAFFQSAVGQRTPSRGDLESQRQVFCERVPARISLSGGSYAPSTDVASYLDDWLIAPLAWWLDDDTHDWLLPQRQTRGIHLPATWLFAAPPQVVAAADELRVLVSGSTAATFKYWHDGLRERHYRNTGARVGCQLVVGDDWLERQIEDGAALCWLVTLTVTKRGQYSGEFDETPASVSWLKGGVRMVWPNPWKPPSVPR
jgi:NACHT domain